jgi:hypothetical protein
MAQIINIVATTELEAINAMLRAIGLQPVLQADLDALNGDDITNAVGVLRDATREVLAQGWRFNTKFGKEIAPAGSYAWVDSSGVTTTLNIFKRPSTALAWRLTDTYKNINVDLIEALSDRYQEAAANVMVLYDRVKNRDGVEQSTHPFLYLDVTLAMDFEKMPDAARRYALLKATRRFVQGNGEQGLTRLSSEDEQIAYKLLAKEHGLRQDVNLFDSADSFYALGMRPMNFGGGLSRIVYPQ